LGDQRGRKIKRFGVIGYERNIKLTNVEKCKNLFDILPQIFDHVITEIIGDHDEESMIGMSYDPDLNQPILIPFRPRQNVNGQILTEKFEHFIQSNSNVRLEDQAGTLRITKVVPQVGKVISLWKNC